MTILVEFLIHFVQLCPRTQTTRLWSSFRQPQLFTLDYRHTTVACGNGKLHQVVKVLTLWLERLLFLLYCNSRRRPALVSRP